jgi:hypothetical protein
MKYLLLVWGLGGPWIDGVYSTMLACKYAERESTEAVHACIAMDLDTVDTDVVLWNNDNLEIRR